jgi:hypothetical protein
MDLGNFGRRQQHHIECDLAERAGEQPEKAHRFGEPVAGHMPSRYRHP